jgi:2-keto-3-deoxy-L-rhamnonate aldolase RhmA
MTDNTFQDGLEAGVPQLGPGAITCSPTIVETYGRVGLDFVWLDLEHSGISPTDSTAMEDLVRAAAVGGTELVVRVTSSEPAVVRKVLDAGVRNVVVPRVETASEVERVVKASRFDYDDGPGERGVGIGRANYWGEDISADYRRREDRSVSVGVNIENHTAIENLEEILSVPELGFVLLGHQDLSVSMGAMPDDPAVQDAIETYRETADAAGVPYGRAVGMEPDAIEAAVEAGYRMLLVGDELGAVRHAFGDRIRQYE